MRKSLLLSLFFLGVFASAKAQWQEDFNDNDFTNHLLWTGNTADFFINDSMQLQSANLSVNSVFYLSTTNQMLASTEWEFWVKLAFNTSSANFVDAYLAASSADLQSPSTSGYFVRMGNTEDEISLYRKDSTGVVTKIIDGVDGVLNHSQNVMRIKVTCNESNHWTLYRDATATGSSFVAEGTATDSTYSSSAFFGFLIKQSTSSFFQKHFFDDIEIKKLIADNKPPEIISAVAVSSKEVDVLFNEPVAESSILAPNFSAGNNLGMPSDVTRDEQNHALIHLTFADTFTNGYAYTLSVRGLEDAAGNAIQLATATFSFYTAAQYDVIIDEIFPDPSPQVALPGFEWIEIKNVSPFPVNLKGWTVGDLTSSGSIREIILQPDSLLILCSASAFDALSSFGKASAVNNFPSLDNDEDILWIKNEHGKVIHAVSFSSDSYKSELKKGGGWSLEMIDTKNPCSSFSNWIASKDNSGGTPGRNNSVSATNADTEGPKIIQAFANGVMSVTIVFDETVDSLQAATASNYTFESGLNAASVVVVSPLFNKAEISLRNPLSEGIIYTVKARNISDCAGNQVTSENEVKFALAQNAEHSDVVINEILFNPKPGCVDYVELYNRSGKAIDLSKYFIASRNSSNMISNITPVATSSFLLFPKDFIVLTTDPDVVKNCYLTKSPGSFLKMKNMPSFPNDEGEIIFMTMQEEIIDEVRYSEKWHFPLITNTAGVSLERIDYDGPSVQSNFHSAAGSAGYGTPGYKNSQSLPAGKVNGEITVTPEIFSPDNDGQDDFVLINYSFPTPGFVANISIFDASGRVVRFLQKNSLSGLKGYYRWDGLDDKNRKLPQGIYIIYTQIFNKEGERKEFKNSIVLARRW